MTLRRATKPCRTTWWSSTTRVLIRSTMPSFLSVRQSYAERDRSTVFRETHYVQCSANLIRTFAHSLKSEVPPCRQIRVSCLKSNAVVGDRQSEIVWMITQIERCVGGFSGTNYVGQRLLCDPEHFVLDRWSEGPINAPDFYTGFQMLGRTLFHE